MVEISSGVEDASHWDSMPFKPPPLPFRGKVRSALTDLICLVGMTVAKATHIVKSSQKITAPQKILVVRRGGLGDVLMATTLLRRLREHFPSAKVYVLASKQALVGLDWCTWVDEILEVPTSKKDWLPLLPNLRKERIDTAFILHRFFAVPLLALLAGIPQRLGFDWKNHGFALTGSIAFTPARSQTLQIGQLLTLLGKPAADACMEFSVSENAMLRACEMLESWGHDPARPLVGIHLGGGETAGSSEPPKRWLP